MTWFTQLTTVIIVFIAVCGGVFAQDDSPCDATLDGYTWDLSPLRRSQGDEDYPAEDFFYTYTLNICAPTRGVGRCRDLRSSVCQYYKTPPGVFADALGSYSGTDQYAPQWSLLPPPNNDPALGVQVKLPNGDICLDGRYESFIQFECDKNAPPVPAISVVETNCRYTFSMRTSYGCPHQAVGASGGLSNGSWFLIILFAICLPLYLVGGCAYKRKMKQTTGCWESCPNSQFWAAIPSLTWEGCKFSLKQLKACYAKHCDKNKTYDDI